MELSSPMEILPVTPSMTRHRTKGNSVPLENPVCGTLGKSLNRKYPLQENVLITTIFSWVLCQIPSLQRGHAHPRTFQKLQEAAFSPVFVTMIFAMATKVN